MNIDDDDYRWPEGFIEDILMLLDRIEIKDESSLAGQRFDICEKHGLIVEFDEMP